MPRKVPLVRVGVQRNGVTMYPTIGVPFDFTASELDDLVKLNKQTQVDYVREPVNEDKMGDDERQIAEQQERDRRSQEQQAEIDRKAREQREAADRQAEIDRRANLTPAQRKAEDDANAKKNTGGSGL